MIKVNKLKKSYGNIHAVKGIDFAVKKGSFFAFLGPNGAGKSTTINILCTLLEKNEGNVIVNGYELGKDDDDIRKSIGVVFQHYMLDGKLTVRQNLMIRGHFYQMKPKDIEERLKWIVSLLQIDYLDQAYKTLSGGQKRRADIARALIHQPKILFLDEPTTGLDPKTRQDVWRVIETLRQQEMTIFLTTHYMEEAAQADQIVIINHGEIAAQGTPDALKKTYAKDTLRLAGNHEDIQSYLEKKRYAFTLKTDVFYVEITSLEAISMITDLKPHLTGFEMIQATLDDVFLDITKGGVS
jgi:multidrug/hemolysin transport system ATP-binding protein